MTEHRHGVSAERGVHDQIGASSPWPSLGVGVRLLDQPSVPCLSTVGGLTGVPVSSDGILLWLVSGVVGQLPQPAGGRCASTVLRLWSRMRSMPVFADVGRGGFAKVLHQAAISDTLEDRREVLHEASVVLLTMARGAGASNRISD